jgi:hypothetical protein
MTRSRPTGVGSTAVGVGAILLAVTAALLWPQQAVSSVETSGWRMQAGGSVFGPVAIVSVDTLPLWADPADSAVTVALSNTTGAPASTEVWWILGRMGDRHPWVDPVKESRHLTVAVPAHGTQIVRFPALQRLPASGSLALSAWVHTRDPVTGKYLHSDGVGMTAPLTVRTAQPGIVRLSESMTLVKLLQVHTPDRVPWGSQLPVTTSVVNDSDSDVVVSTAVTFEGPDGPMDVQLPSRTLGAGQVIDKTELTPVPDRGGSYRVSVRVDLVGPNGQHWPVAGLATPAPVVVRP